MPENYIAMFNAPQIDRAKAIVEQAEPDIAGKLLRASGPDSRFPRRGINLYDRFMSGPVNPIFYRLLCERRPRSGPETRASAAGSASAGCPHEQYPA